MDDIYWVNFVDGYVECLCVDKLGCKKEERLMCKEYLISFTKIERRANKKFDIDKAAINKLKRARTELEKTLRKVKI